MARCTARMLSYALAGEAISDLLFIRFPYLRRAGAVRRNGYLGHRLEIGRKFGRRALKQGNRTRRLKFYQILSNIQQVVRVLNHPRTLTPLGEGYDTFFCPSVFTCSLLSRMIKVAKFYDPATPVPSQFQIGLLFMNQESGGSSEYM